MFVQEISKKLQNDHIRGAFGYNESSVPSYIGAVIPRNHSVRSYIENKYKKNHSVLCFIALIITIPPWCMNPDAPMGAITSLLVGVKIDAR